MKILIVDDEIGMQKTLSLFLQHEGYEVLSVSTAQDALQALRTHEYDLVVTDIIMPNMSGIDLLEWIRKEALNTQIIIMTGEPTVGTAIQAVQNGAIDYLTKPILKDVFLKSIRNSQRIRQLTVDRNLLEVENQTYQKGLEEIVEKQTSALRRSTKSIIQLLSQVVEFRDPYTAGHQRRVGNLAAEIARKMQLEDEKVETIRVIGYIHDIGKIVIPAEILCKPGELSQIERSLLKTHSQSGYEMIQKTDLPEVIATTIYEHHERMDGSGYPRGIKGARICIEAKIMMVADVVEAMQSHRPYRPSLGQRAALKEIEKNENNKFDPLVVRVCLDLFRKDGYKIDDSPHDFKIPLSIHT